MTTTFAINGITLSIKTSPGGYIEAKTHDLGIKYMATFSADVDALRFDNADFTNSYKNLTLHGRDAVGKPIKLTLLIDDLYNFHYERNMGMQMANVELMTMMKCMRLEQYVWQSRLENIFGNIEKRLDKLEKHIEK